MRRQESDSDDHVRPHDAAQSRRNRREGRHLHDHRPRDDPRVASLSARKVVPDEDVRERREPDRQREGCEDFASL